MTSSTPVESTLTRIRRVLAEAGFDTEGLAQVVVRGDTHGHSLVLRSGDTPLHTLAALFVVGEAVPEADVNRAVAPTSVEDWTASGLLEVQGGDVRPLVRLEPYDDLVLASDFFRFGAAPLRADHVIGAGRATMTLSNLTVRRPNRATLDLGTGCGVLALQAARHSGSVTGVDRSPRAVMYARLNAELNGVRNAGFVEGDMLEPPTEGTFDLVVSNPPFVISPEARFDFRDSGRRGDLFCRALVRAIPLHLDEGGWFQMLFNWAHLAGHRWRDDLTGWFEGTGCDAWVLRSDTSTPEAYAATWIREGEGSASPRFDTLLDEWLAFYEREGIEAVSFGALTLRKATGRTNWTRFEDAPDSMRGPSGDHVERIFANEDFLRGLPNDRALLDARLVRSPDVRLDTTSVPAEEGWTFESGRLRLDRGLAWSGEIDSYGIDMLAKCDGTQLVRDLVVDIADTMGVDFDKLVDGGMKIVRRLVERGFVVPA